MLSTIFLLSTSNLRILDLPLPLKKSQESWTFLCYAVLLIILVKAHSFLKCTIHTSFELFWRSLIILWQLFYSIRKSLILFNKREHNNLETSLKQKYWIFLNRICISFISPRHCSALLWTQDWKLLLILDITIHSKIYINKISPYFKKFLNVIIYKYHDRLHAVGCLPQYTTVFNDIQLTKKKKLKTKAKEGMNWKK